MATIATAEVRIIADTSRFVPDLRRKLRAAFASLGDNLGNELIQRIDRRFSQRLNTIMTQAARRAGDSFTRSFNQAIGDAGLSESLRRQLSGAGSRRGARLAGEVIAEAFGEGIEGSNRRITQGMLDALSAQTIIRAAGFAGQDTAQAFADGFQQNLRRDVSERINDAFRDAANDANNQIPPLFRGTGERAGNAFSNGMEEELRDLNQGILDALAGSDVDTSAFFAGQRSGIQFSDGLFDSLSDRLGRQMEQEFTDAVAELEQLAQIPRTFRRIGQTSATNFADSFTEEVDNSLTASLGRLFLRLGDRASEDSGRRAGGRFSNGFINALQALPSLLQRLIGAIVVRPLAGLANIFAQMGSELLSMAGQALAVVALLEALSGLLFGLPAVTSLAGAAIAAIIVPLRGTGEAFSAASGDAEEFEEALEGLTPAAQSVAREFREIIPALRDLRLRAQAAFFAEIDGVITSVADNLVGPLSDGLEAAAGAFGRIVAQIGEFLSQAQTAETVGAVFETLTGIFDALAQSTVPFLEGFRNLVDEFLPRIADLEGPLSRMGAQFRDWTEEIIESGEAMDAFDRGLSTLEDIFSIVGDISGIFNAMFDAAESEGIDALGAVAEAVADIRAEFESIEGQELLGSVFDALGRIADVVSDVFGAIFENIAELSPSIAEFFEEVGPPIQDLIDGLSEGIENLLEEGGTEAFRELAEALAGVDWADVGSRLGQLLGKVGPVIELLGNVLDVVLEIIDFVIELASFLNDLFGGEGNSDWTQAIQDFFDELLNLDAAEEWIDETDRAIAEFFTQTLPETIENGIVAARVLLEQWWTELQEGWSEFWEGLGGGADLGLTNILNALVPGLGLITGETESWELGFDLQWTEFWTGLVTTVSDTFLGLTANVLSGLSNIGATVSGWITGVRVGWDAFWSGLAATVQTQLVAISVNVSSRLNGVRNTISGWISGARALWNAFWSGLSSSVSSGLAAVRNTASKALSGVTLAFSTFSSGVRNILNNLISFLSGIASSIQSIVGRISGYVSNAISIASSLSSIDLNPFANGGIVTSPTPALVGEAGPEVIIPLTRPQRAVDLVQQSGLLGILAAQGLIGNTTTTSGSEGRPVEVHVHSNNADADQVARKAVRLLERRMSGRGLERTT